MDISPPKKQNCRGIDYNSKGCLNQARSCLAFFLTLGVLLRHPSHAASAAPTAARASLACMAGTRASVTCVAGSVVGRSIHSSIDQSTTIVMPAASPSATSHKAPPTHATCHPLNRQRGNYIARQDSPSTANVASPCASTHCPLT